MVRATMRITEEQSTMKCIDVTIPMLFSACMSAGDALTTVGRPTPYQCVYGRHPPMHRTARGFTVDGQQCVAAEVSSQASAEVDNEPAPTLTMAESLAAELADAQAARPQIKLVTFAPEALQPGNSVRPGKRRPGNNLAGFRSMATDLFKT